jgi:GNAT superfamily N-acetyltransferase
VSFKYRLAHWDDLPALRDLVRAAIEELQRPFLTPEQISASHAIMGVDSRLIDDGTYFVVECDGVVAGCGGWSRRATLVGGDHAAGRDDRLLDPAIDAARVRAMYTHPRFTRRGIGRLVLERCEAGAADEGFCHLELVATLAGQALFRSFGFEVTEAFTDTTSGTAIPLLRMTKPIAPGLPELATGDRAS